MNDGDADAIDDDVDGGDYDDGGDDDADADDVGTCESTSVAGRLFWQGQARRQRRRSVLFYYFIHYLSSLFIIHLVAKSAIVKVHQEAPLFGQRVF